MKALMILTGISSLLALLLLWSWKLFVTGVGSILLYYVVALQSFIIYFAILISGVGLVQSLKTTYQYTPFAVVSRSLYVVSIGVLVLSFTYVGFIIAILFLPTGAVILLNASQKTFTEANILEKLTYILGILILVWIFAVTFVHYYLSF